jgi:alpha-tubulin suppressor-like RCC1 family protein
MATSPSLANQYKVLMQNICLLTKSIYIVAFVAVVAIEAMGCSGGKKNGAGDAGGKDGTSGQAETDDSGGTGGKAYSVARVADSDWANVSAGMNHSCAIKTNNTLFCWGSNSDGQLGNNSTTDSPVPVQESTAATDWVDLSATYSHTCAIKTDGRLLCWGRNSLSQLDNNPNKNNLVPVPESTTATDWASLSTNMYHTCAIKTNGKLFCWGYNDLGQLGNNSTKNSLAPVQESKAGTDWARVSVGEFHTCAIKTDGRLFCWGNNSSGQLGNNSTSDSHVPVQESTAASDWARVSACGFHTCAIKTNGTLFCWGDNNHGQLGNNSTKGSLAPAQESTAATDWVDLSAGVVHTCAIKTNGGLFCWGYNDYNELGNDATMESLVPIQESAFATDWVKLSAGSSHTCAIKTNGELFCWGNDDYGELGNNSNANSPAPAQDGADATD